MQFSENIDGAEPKLPAWAAISLIVSIGAFLCFPILTIRFQWDDISLVVTNPYIRDAKSLWGYLDAGRPVRSLTLFIDYALWGYNPRGFHLTNLILHLLGAVLLFRFLDGRFTGRWTAFGTALLFTAHPAGSEAIAVVTHRKEMLAMIFLLASLSSYIKASQPEYFCANNELPRMRKSRFFLSMIFYLAGLGSKQVVVVLPLLAFTADVFLSGAALSAVFRRRRLYYLSYISIPLAFVIVAIGDWRIFEYFPKENIFGEFHLKVLSISAWSITQYLRILLWPVFLSADHQFGSPGIFSVILGVTLWLAMLIAGFRLRYINKIVGFGLIWIPLNLLMIINLIPANQPLADRYLYIPMAGFCMILAGLMKEASKRDSFSWAILRWIGFFMIVSSSVFTHISESVYLERTESFYMLLWMMAGVAIFEIIIKSAVRNRDRISFKRYYFASILALILINSVLLPAMYFTVHKKLKTPYDIIVEDNPNFERKVLDMQHGIKPTPDTVIDSSKTKSGKLLQLVLLGFVAFPLVKRTWAGGNERFARYLVILEVSTIVLGVYNNRRLNEWAHDLSLWQATLRTDPGSFRANNNLGVFWKKWGKPDRAERYYDHAKNINPNNTTVWHDLSVLYIEKKDYPKAEEALLQILEIDPQNIGALLNLGNLCNVTGRSGDAMLVYRRVLELEPENPRALYNIAVMLEGSGDYAGAYENCSRALKSRSDFPKAQEMCGPQGRLKNPIPAPNP